MPAAQSQNVAVLDPKEAATSVLKWERAITRAEKFFSNALEHGRKVYLRYKDDRQDQMTMPSTLRRVNIFYANVNTLKESLFNSLPKPEVSRLHKGDYEDDIARVAALILQRGLTYEVHCAQHFDAAVTSAILDRLVPGVGQVWLRYGDNEEIFIDVLYWEDFIYEPARCWENVSWVGRKHEFTRKEFIENYGEEAFNQASMMRDDSNITPKEISQGKYCVYEIWDKKSKKVFHIVKGAKAPVKELDDPYGLRGFFPCPKPLMANPTTSAYLPVTDFHIAQDQYIELDTIYARMSLITKAVKVAGCYDSATTAIGRMLEGQENVLIPVDNWAMYAERGGAKGMIDWYPVEQVVQVYEALRGQYEGLKATLYEVTGMSDIMRGASNQYETAAAQEIKAQFASVRMNGYQRDVAHFVRDILVIMSEIMVHLYSDEKFQAIIGNFNEADQQYIPQAMQVLRNDLLRKYKVDVESDSLTQADWALEKGQRMELVGSISQYLTAAIPAVQESPELGTLLMAMLKFSVAGFKGAAEVEGILDQQLSALIAQANQPQEPQPSPEEQKAQAEMQKMQMEAQLKQQEAVMNAQLKERESQQRMALEREQAQADMAVKQMEMAQKERMFQLDMQLKMMELEFKREEARIKVESQAVQGQMKLDQQAEANRQSAEAGAMKNEQAKQAGDLKIKQQRESTKEKRNEPKK